MKSKEQIQKMWRNKDKEGIKRLSSEYIKPKDNAVILFRRRKSQ